MEMSRKQKQDIIIKALNYVFCGEVTEKAIQSLSTLSNDELNERFEKALIVLGIWDKKMKNKGAIQRYCEPN